MTTSAEIQKSRIIKCCENYFAQQDLHIQREIEKLIASEMAPVRFPASLWRKPAATREEALKRLEKPTDEFGWSAIDLVRSNYNSNFMRRLLKLAQKADSVMIRLSEEDANVLKWEDKTLQA